jgi:hypothetical protein
MHALALLLSATIAIPASSARSAGASAATPSSTPTTAARWRPGSWRPPENLLAGPARCLLRYLEAVRQAGPRPERSTGRLPPAHERDYAAARALTAPRTLEEIERRAAVGDEHPLAPWREAARAHVLESFQLVAVRRAPRGAAVVTVSESFWRPPGSDVERGPAEYLVARVHGEWKVVDRSPGRTFDDGDLREGYAGFFDDPAGTR